VVSFMPQSWSGCNREKKKPFLAHAIK